MSENTREVRCLMAGVELRKAPDGKGPGTMVGYAAVFDRFSQDLGHFREVIRPGAFADALPKSDVRALVNHDANQLIGRAKAGTLRMVEDGLGLRTEIDLPDTQVGRDVAESLRRGDMDGMSFCFSMPDEADAQEWDWGAEVPVRTIARFGEIYDVGPVTYPAYTDTTAAMRSLDRSRPTPSPGPDPAPTPEPAPTNPPIDLSPFLARLRLAEATTP